MDRRSPRNISVIALFDCKNLSQHVHYFPPRPRAWRWRPPAVHRSQISDNIAKPTESVPSIGMFQKAPKTPIARPSITPILRMDQVSSIYNPGNDFFWREEGPCRARARTSPARPSLGVPPTRFRGFPVTALSQTRLNLQVNSSLGQPAWFATVPWTGTSRSQVGVPPRISTFLIWQQHSKYKKPIERDQFPIVPGARLFSLGKRI